MRLNHEFPPTRGVVTFDVAICDLLDENKLVEVVILRSTMRVADIANRPVMRISLRKKKCPKGTLPSGRPLHTNAGDDTRSLFPTRCHEGFR